RWRDPKSKPTRNARCRTRRQMRASGACHVEVDRLTLCTVVYAATHCFGKGLIAIKATKHLRVQRLPITQARNTLGAVLRRIHLNKEYVILEKDGIPLAGVMDITSSRIISSSRIRR